MRKINHETAVQKDRAFLELDKGKELVFVKYVAVAKRSFAKKKEKLD